jgi:hypothetical protein
MSTGLSALAETMLNLSRYHREHEKFYSQSPLAQAIALQRSSRALKALADHWQEYQPGQTPLEFPYAGCVDLNEKAAIEASGILFLEGEGEPPEITRMKRELASAADDFAATGTWMSEAMQASWAMAEGLLALPEIADLLGERHRIIANDWQAAGLNTLIASLLSRAVAVLGQVDFSPAALRSDLAGPGTAVPYLFSASELIDHAADLVAHSASLVHDNERRWRVFHDRVAVLAGNGGQGQRPGPRGSAAR